jgi:hypothetical protein
MGNQRRSMSLPRHVSRCSYLPRRVTGSSCNSSSRPSSAEHSLLRTSTPALFTRLPPPFTSTQRSTGTRLSPARRGRRGHRSTCTISPRPETLLYPGRRRDGMQTRILCSQPSIQVVSRRSWGDMRPSSCCFSWFVRYHHGSAIKWAHGGPSVRSPLYNIPRHMVHYLNSTLPQLPRRLMLKAKSVTLCFFRYY